MTSAFHLSIPERPSADGVRRAWIFHGDEGVVGLRIDTKKQRWIWSKQDATEIPGLVDFIHDQARALDEAGFNVRRWWHLWRCWDCGAAPLDSCLHAVKHTRLVRCHRGRKPRGERP